MLHLRAENQHTKSAGLDVSSHPVYLDPDTKPSPHRSTHVFEDLKPYICTFEYCSHPDEAFSSREEWLRHERGHYHHHNQTPEQTKTIATTTPCPLCKTPILITPIKDNSETQDDWARHLAQHMEEFSYAAVPARPYWSWKF